MQHTPSSMSRIARTCSSAMILALCVLFVSPSWALARDRDGSRLRAKRAQPTSAHKDALSAPKDRADWRYIELSKPSTLRISVVTKSHTAPVKIQLSDSTGKSIQARSVAKPSSVSLQATLKPGVYYIGVELASGAAQYTLQMNTK